MKEEGAARSGCREQALQQLQGLAERVSAIRRALQAEGEPDWRLLAVRAAHIRRRLRPIALLLVRERIRRRLGEAGLQEEHVAALAGQLVEALEPGATSAGAGRARSARPGAAGRKRR